MSERREELLERCLDYLLDHGVADMSLRPMAAEAGTSARLLIYHFGSREKLLTSVMRMVRSRLQEIFRQSDRRIGHTRDPLATFWKASTRGDALRYLGLLLEVQVLALRHPRTYRRYLDDTSTSWLRLIERALPSSARRPSVATLCAAVFDGLTLELLATSDRRRTQEALTLFSTLLHQWMKKKPRSRS